MSNQLPRISIVIPSYNQGAFIGETLESIAQQNYPNLELFVFDGGSKDETVNIIKQYENIITYWESVPDRGQSHAINKGFERATG
ncbi:MAG: glycosyltransferase, partial [Bacteroidia bacterium]